jgi:hypothetical protein
MSGERRRWPRARSALAAVAGPSDAGLVAAGRSTLARSVLFWAAFTLGACDVLPPAPSARSPESASTEGKRTRASSSEGSRPRVATGAGSEASLRPLGPCVPATYEVCFNALDDNCNGALDEGCGTPAGVIQFMIAWDTPRADVDLNVTDPSGELIEAGRVAQSGLIKGRDCPGRRQECGGVNLENVFLEGTKAPKRGTYHVSVALESLGGDEPPIWVTLSARLGAKRYAYEIRLIEPEDERHVDLVL